MEGDRLVHPLVQPPGLFPGEFPIAGNLAADEALAHKHVLERICFADQSSTTLGTAGSNQKSLLNRQVIRTCCHHITQLLRRD